MSCDLGLSTAKRPCPARRKVIGGKTALSTAKQPYPTQCKLIDGASTLFFPG
jgi:hypothetical protein